jgi:all-trans-8'-apo-beta-carotenal 15,15'-oxygenase
MSPRNASSPIDPSNEVPQQLRPFQSQFGERDYRIRQIDGRIPAGLTGTLYRIGPGKFTVGQTRLRTIFEGDGMISRFILDGQSIRYTNRYVRTPNLQDGIAANRLRRPTGATAVRPAVWRNLQKPANVANTHVIPFKGELLALWEFGRPHRVDRDTLDTLGEEHFDGALGYLGAFSAHPKVDPDTGEMFNFGLDLLPTPRLRCYRVLPDGRASEINSVTMWDMGWNHDFALTQKYLVFVLDPLARASMIPTLLRTRTLVDALEFDVARKPSRFVLVPRDGSTPRIIEYPGQIHIHMTNAYEDRGDTVIEFVRFTNLDFLKLPDRIPTPATGPTLPVTDWGTSELVQFRVPGSGRISETVINPTHAMEFPQFDQRRCTRQHRYTYSAFTSDPAAPYYRGIGKYDHERAAFSGYEFEQCAIGEPIFVPRHDGADEDDGWLLAVNHHLTTDTSALEIFDTHDLPNGPIATAHLDHHIPVGFHGSFTRRVAHPGPARPTTYVR